MHRLRVVHLLLALVGLFGVSVRAQAQPAAGGPAVTEPRFAGAFGYGLRTVEAGGRRVRVTLERLGGDLKLAGHGVTVHEGPMVRAALAVRLDAALVAVVRGGSTPFVRFAVVRLDAQGEPGSAPVTSDASAQRTGDASPDTVIACPDPEGFTVMWQELVGQSGRPEARTYLARIAPDGSWVERPHVVDVPWAIAAFAFNGHGYHLALYYTGSGPADTRLSFVTLDRAGHPEQHPWWVTRPEMIDEVQLSPIAGGVAAFYRGGADASSLRSVEVTSVGQWGTDPGAPTEHGSVSADAPFALRAEPGGGVHLLR